MTEGLAAFKKNTDRPLAGSAGAACGQGRVGTDRLVDRTLDRPGLGTIEAGPHGDIFPVPSRSVTIAIDQNVTAFDREAYQPAEGPAGVSKGAIGQYRRDLEVLPSVAAVLAPGFPAHGGIDARRIEMTTGGIVDAPVPELRDCTFAGSIGWKRIARSPALPAVIAVDGGVVHLGVVGWVIRDRVVPGWTQKASLVFAVPESNAVFGHAHGGNVPILVWLDAVLVLRLPAFTVVFAAIDREGGFVGPEAHVAVLHEGEDVAAFFIDGHPATLPSRVSDGDEFCPRLPAVLAPAHHQSLFPPVTLSAGRSVSRNKGPIHRGHDIGKTPPAALTFHSAGKELGDLEARFAEERCKGTLGGFCDEFANRETGQEERDESSHCLFLPPPRRGEQARGFVANGDRLIICSSVWPLRLETL